MGKKEELEDNHRSPSSHHNQKRECFVGHSHKVPWRDDIICTCEETLPKFGLQPWYADDQFEPTKSLRDKVVDMVANARYGIYDLSWWRPDEQSAWKMPQNVLIELGMAIALNRPILLLRHAGNRASGLSLPTCLDSISQRIVEFSGGPTLKRALEERLPQWLDVPPERAWWMRYCLFGERTCTYRESYPQIIQCGQKTIGCHIADGKDIDRPDFRSLIEDELGRYSDISFDYLDTLLPTAGYDFQLCTYCQTVRSTPFAIYRITPETTAETFIAIGMSIALENQFKCEIPKFIFTTDARSVPSLLAGYDVVEAKTTKERQKHLRKFIPVVMRKVRESVWKPELLPFFVEFLPQSTETFLFKKEQALFPENEGKNALSNNKDDINDNDLNGGMLSNAHSIDRIGKTTSRAINKFDRLYELQMLFSENPKQRFKTSEIATILGVSEDTAVRYLNSLGSTGRLPLMKEGRFWFLMEGAIFNQSEKQNREKQSTEPHEPHSKGILITPVSNAINKADRLYTLQKLFWKDPKQRFKTSEIATALEVSEDTALRYLKELVSTEHLPLLREGRFWRLEENPKIELLQGINEEEKNANLPTDDLPKLHFSVTKDTLEVNNEEEDQRHCESVIGQLTDRQLEVLQAFANGLRPSEVAELLSISAPTVSTHTTVLLSSCRDAWSIEAKERLDYRFLQLKFEKYFEEHDQSEDN